MKKFIIDLGVVPTISDPIPLLCYNNGAIAQMKEPRSHQKSKHILRRFQLIREIVTRGDVVVERVALTDNVVDDGYYVAYKPITLPCIFFVFIEMKFIHCHSCVMFAMKSMSMCND